jgi:hypothetical protein
MTPAALLLVAVAFAFPNEQGTQLLATREIATPQALRVAICSDGRQVPIQFDRRQSEGRNSTGRQTPQNFANTAGNVFRIVGGTIGADASCLLADEAFLAGAMSVTLARPPETARCAKAMYPDFQADKGRPVVGCWPIGASGGVQVAIIEFTRRLNQALAALVVVDGDRRIYIDYPADFRGPGSDLWRADDGGEIHAEGFGVVFLLKRGSTYLLALDWKGAEGSTLSLHTSDGTGQFKELFSESWYRAPM